MKNVHELLQSTGLKYISHFSYVDVDNNALQRLLLHT